MVIPFGRNGGGTTIMNAMEKPSSFCLDQGLFFMLDLDPIDTGLLLLSSDLGRRQELSCPPIPIRREVHHGLPSHA